MRETLFSYNFLNVLPIFIFATFFIYEMNTLV